MPASELERLLPSRREARAVPPDVPVQLSVRVPAELRDAARDLAERTGTSLTQLVEDALRAEIARRRDPAAQFSEQLARSIRERLAAALDDGSWDEAVREAVAGDVDLAS